MSDSLILPEWIDAVAQLLGQMPDALRFLPVTRHDGVWYVEFDGQMVAVAKRLPEKRSGDTVSPVSAEAAVLQCVSPPAARYLAHLEEPRILLTEWVGQTTINDMVQQSVAPSPVVERCLVDRFSALEQRFAESRDILIPVAYPMDYPRYLRDSLDGPLALASNTFGIPDSLLCIIEDRLSALTPTLGPLDCNAQNVIATKDTIWFVDLSRIGWDWPERRLVQYAYCLGAFGGRPRNVLTSEAVQRYAQRMNCLRSTSPDLLAFGLDAHAFLAELVIVDRLRQLIESPERLGQLALAWDKPVERMACMKRLINTSLSGDEHIRQARDRALSQIGADG